MKRIFSLLALSAAAGAMLFAVIPAGAGTTTTVKVTAKEYSFVLSRKSAPHGKVTFNVTNKGKFKHDFKIAGKKTPMLRAGKSTPLTVTLVKGKTYTYTCTVPGHTQLGMKGKFKAT